LERKPDDILRGKRDWKKSTGFGLKEKKKEVVARAPLHLVPQLPLEAVGNGRILLTTTR